MFQIILSKVATREAWVNEVSKWLYHTSCLQWTRPCHTSEHRVEPCCDVDCHAVHQVHATLYVH